MKEFFNITILELPIINYLLFAIILIIAIFLKKHLSTIINRVFFTVFKNFANNDSGKHFKTYLQKPMEGFVLTILFFIAFLQLYPLLDKIILINRNRKISNADHTETIQRTYITLMDLLEQLFLAFLIFYFVLIIINIINFLFYVAIDKALEQKDRQKQQVYPLTRDILKVFTWIIGFFVFLGVVFKVNVGAIIAGLGVGGIAIAFAAKDSVENLLASFLVLMDKPFTIGDWIKIDGVEGNIEKIGFRSSTIRTFDKSVVVFPNKRFIDSKLENFSERGSRRVKFSIGAIYGLTEQTLKATINEIKSFIKNTPGTTQEPSVTLNAFGDSAVEISITYFVIVNDKVNYSEVFEKINFGIYNIMYGSAKGFAFPTSVQLPNDGVNNMQESANVSEQ